jgi:endogenous inhibitor of DNA gyrase (YacG/DUF329 family)
MAGMAKCPICDGVVKPRAENPSFPFCTARCKTIDLGKWMNEEYRIPTPVGDDELDEDDDGGASDGSSDGSSKTNEDMRH